MKWCVIFTVFLSFSVSAEIAAQQEKVNLNLSKANLQTLFQEIQRQTGLYFVYNEEYFRRGECECKVVVGETSTGRYFPG